MTTPFLQRNRQNVGDVCFCKTQTCKIPTFYSHNWAADLWCDKTVAKVWLVLGLDTKPLGQQLDKMMFWLKIPGFVAKNKTIAKIT